MKRLALLFALVLVAQLQAATITLIPETVQGVFSFGHVGDASPTPVHINAGTPANQGNVDFRIDSSVWNTTANLTMRIVLEKSFDGGVTWSFLTGNNPDVSTDHFTSGALGKNGLPQLPQFGTNWFGEALDIRGTFTPGSTYSWGLSVSF